MTGVTNKFSTVGAGVVSIALSLAFGSGGASLDGPPTQGQKAAGGMVISKRMQDGRLWTTQNLNVSTVASSCYEDAEPNCRTYGRLYTWESALRACESLGEGWRLPTDEEWRQLAKHYGGISEDSNDAGKGAYQALLTGGRSGFNVLLGGNRNADDGRYARLEAHGFYWTASEGDPAGTPFYNFGRGGQALHRQASGNKQMAVSVRCVRE